MTQYDTLSVPVSCKGIVFEAGKVWLRENERQEWELPGGKLEKDEQPEETVVRELHEELGFEVEVKKLAQVHLYEIDTSTEEPRGVLVLTYLCTLLSKSGTFELEGEAGPAKFQAFPVEEIDPLPMPQFYKDSILSI